MSKALIVAVDFDGTCVEHFYPAVGPDVPGAVETLLLFQEAGWKILLWTMRSGLPLEDAVAWFRGHGIELYGVNTNPDQHTWTDSPKVYAHFYIDDAAVGCPLVLGRDGGRDYVDWREIRKVLGFDESIKQEKTSHV